MHFILYPLSAPTGRGIFLFEYLIDFFIKYDIIILRIILLKMEVFSMKSIFNLANKVISKYNVADLEIQKHTEQVQKDYSEHLKRHKANQEHIASLNKVFNTIRYK